MSVFHLFKLLLCSRSLLLSYKSLSHEINLCGCLKWKAGNMRPLNLHKSQEMSSKMLVDVVCYVWVACFVNMVS